MKLVLIQGDILARYEDRKQGAVARINWGEHSDPKATVEDFRANGLREAEEQRDQA